MMANFGKIEKEVDELKLAMEKKEKEWLCEKQKLQDRIQSLKEELRRKEPRSEDTSLQENKTRLDRLEKEVERLKESEHELRQLRRKNLVISNVPDSDCSVEETVKKLFHDVLKVNVQPIDVRFLARHGDGGNLVLVSMKNLREKLEVMRTKHKLRALQRKMFIMDDLTRAERETQRRIRERVKEENEKGSNWKIGYGKVCVGGQWVPWELIQ